MLNTSSAYKKEIYEGNNRFLAYADITLNDGTILNLDNSDIWEGGFKISEGTTESGKFCVGSAVTGKLTLILNNIYDDFSEYDFFSASVVAYVGLKLPDGTIEKIRKGFFTVDEPTYNGSTITLECLDNMGWLDVAYSEVDTVYPATLQTIVADICLHCDIENSSGQFDNCFYTVEQRPDNESLTCRDVLSYVCQIACCFAKINNSGNLEIKWYKTNCFENSQLYGGTYKYTDGDTVSGGTYSYGDGDSAYDGTYESAKEFHHIYNLSSQNIYTDDIEITGVKVANGETETLSGSEGYVLRVEDNPFIESGKEREVAEFLWNKINGLRLRKMDISCIGDPSMEAGDPAVVTDRKGNSYRTLITNLVYTVGNYTSISCDMETPSAKMVKTYSAAAKTAAEMRKMVKDSLGDYAESVNAMNSLALNALGYYETIEKQEDGSSIMYTHDKPTLAESQIVYKKTIDGFFISQDGGNTYTNGFDKSGKAVLNILAAIGITFDWARGGTLTLGGSDNGNGSMKILDDSGSQIGSWGKDGFIATKGTFSGTLAAATGSFSGKVTANEGYIGGTSGFTITSGKMYSKKSAMGQNVSGVYFGTDGIALGPTVNNVSMFEADSSGVVVLQKGFVRGEGLALAYGCGFGADDDLYLHAILQLMSNGKDVMLNAHSGSDGILYLGAYDTDYIQFSNKAFTSGGADVTSDKRLKKDIALLDKKRSYDFIMSLKPSEFRYVYDDEYLHHGFIAQDVLEAKTVEWDVVRERNFSYTPTEKKEKRYFLADTELISDVIAAIQYIDSKVMQFYK